MNKLTKYDIKILGEGPQVAKEIKLRYKSIEDFHNTCDTPFTISSLRTYLSRNIVTSDSFKCAITKLLDINFYEIALSPKQQISAYVNNIYNNIKLYTLEEDMEILDYLLSLCKQENMLIETAMMYRAKARNSYYTNKINHVEEFYDYAIDILPRNEVNKRAYFTCELAYDFFRENIFVKAEKRFQIVKEYVDSHKNELDTKTLYCYYYQSGILYLIHNMYEISKEYFEISIKYAVQNYEKASAIANVGLAYKKQEYFDEALKYYKESLNYHDDSHISTTGIIYNNMSELYRTIGDYRNAQIYINMAFEINEKEYKLINHLICSATYVEIQMELGSYLSYKTYFDVLLSTKGKQLNKADIVLSIKSFINDIYSSDCLTKLSTVIIELKNSSDGSGYIKGLYECLGYIHEKLILLNEGVHREKDY